MLTADSPPEPCDKASKSDGLLRGVGRARALLRRRGKNLRELAAALQILAMAAGALAAAARAPAAPLLHA